MGSAHIPANPERGYFTRKLYKSNLSELVEEMELNTKVQIIGEEVEIPVNEFIYERLKGKRIKVVMQGKKDSL